MSGGRLTYHQKQLRKKQKHLHLRQPKAALPKPIHVHFHDSSDAEHELPEQQQDTHVSRDVVGGTVIPGTAHTQTPPTVNKVREFLAEVVPITQTDQNKGEVLPTLHKQVAKLKSPEILHYSKVTTEAAQIS